MQYLIGSDFSITYYDYDAIEQTFFSQTAELIGRFPFKWNELIYHIIGNQNLTYFKDTTMIISLYQLNLAQAQILFEILREYLRTKVVERVLYKKEFLIVHFHSFKVKEYFEIANLWLAIPYYETIKASFPECTVYIGGVLQKALAKERIALIMRTREKIFLFYCTKPPNWLLDENYTNVYLYYHFPKNLHLESNSQKMAFLYDKMERFHSVTKFLEEVLLESVAACDKL